MSDPPDEIKRLLDERAVARARRDWASADGLRDAIRSLGWEPVDSTQGSSARPLLAGAATAPGYARAEDFESLLGRRPTLDASLLTLLEDHPGDLERLLESLRAHPPQVSWELVVVANAGAQPPLRAGELPLVTVHVTARLGWGDAVNLGLRRTQGAVAVLLDGSVEPTGDFLTPLLDAFADPTVGIAGPWGLVSADGRHFDEATSGGVDAVQAYCLAVRRDAVAAVGGFDPRFRWYRNADLDFSFAVRDRSWRGVAVPGLPLRRHEHRAWNAFPEAERDRLSRRNFYRFLERWGRRSDLLSARGGR